MMTTRSRPARHATCMTRPMSEGTRTAARRKQWQLLPY
ncbi:MAG: hypothetical protein OJF62_000688 [Pseudolabrys sp.]|nr:hypothetical protein [Pseudolabrys sp.]